MAPTPRSARTPVDERKLADLVKTKTDLSIRSQRDVWKQMADELEAPVENVKKAWSKLQEEDAKLKIDLNRRKSLRSSSVDSTNDQLKSAERRRSLRSSSIDKSGLLTPSIDSSCASSICNSPKGEDKRCLRSRSQLSSITESELISMAGGDASILEMPIIFKEAKIPDVQQEDDQEDLDEDTLVLELSNRDGDISEIASEIERIPEDVAGEMKNQRLRLSEPVQSAKKLPTSISPKPKMMGNKNNNKMKRNFCANDSTRAFFDSMAMTVASFPLHFQAKVKIEICKIIGEIEYDLSLPKVN